jgi:copper homeostasis protein CutC
MMFLFKFKSVLLILAFDMVHDPMAALETLLTLGFERVLTSGCDSSALEGLPLIKQLIDQVQPLFLYFLRWLWL